MNNELATFLEELAAMLRLVERVYEEHGIKIALAETSGIAISFNGGAPVQGVQYIEWLKEGDREIPINYPEVIGDGHEELKQALDSAKEKIKEEKIPSRVMELSEKLVAHSEALMSLL